MAFPLVLIYLFFVLIRPHEYIEIFYETSILTYLLIFSFIFWFLSKNKVINSPQIYIMSFLIIAMMFSHIFNGWFGGALQILGKMLPLFVFFMVLSSVIVDHKKMHTVFRLIVVCVVIMAIHGIDQKNHGIGWTGALLSQESRITYIGIFNDPNDLALVMVMALPMAMYLLFQSLNKYYKLIWASSIVLILYAINLTQSRGSLVAVLSICGVYLVNKIGKLKTFAIILILSPITAFFSGRMTDIDASEDSAAGRIEAWYEGIHMFYSNPLFGVGPNQFVEHHYLTAHNSFYLVLAELGFVGYTLWITLLLISISMAYKASLVAVKKVDANNYGVADHDKELNDRIKDSEILQAQSYTIFMAMIGYITAAFFLSRSYNIVLFVLCALCVSIFYMSREYNEELVRIEFHNYIGRYIMLSIMSILALIVIVKILLILM